MRHGEPDRTALALELGHLDHLVGLDVWAQCFAVGAAGVRDVIEIALETVGVDSQRRRVHGGEAHGAMEQMQHVMTPSREEPPAAPCPS